MSDNEIPTPAMRSMSEEQFDTQRATMHYVRTLAILAGLFVYTSFMSAILGLGVWVAAVSDDGASVFGGLVAFVAAMALLVGFVWMLGNFIGAFRTANKWAQRLAVNPFGK
jgi:hypothetical protein